MREVQFFHAPRKVVPRDKLSAGKVSSAVQPSHALLKLRLSLGEVENEGSGKEVRPVQPCHVLAKVVPRDRSKAGKEVSDEQCCHA